MSYNKMMKHQRSSIRKHKRRSYTANVIYSIPSDKEMIYPPKTSNIEDYDISALTPQQTEIAKVLMEEGYRGLDFLIKTAQKVKRHKIYNLFV